MKNVTVSQKTTKSTKKSKSKTTKAKTAKVKNTKAKTSKAKTKKARKTKSAPVVEVSEPVVEVSEPVVEVSAPVVEVSAPVVEVSAPVVEDNSLVVNDSSKVAEDSAQLVNEEEQSVTLLIKSLTGLNTQIVELYSHLKNISNSKKFTEVYREYKNTRKSFTKFEDEFVTQSVKGMSDAERRSTKKKKRRNNVNKTTGLYKKRDVTPELAVFLGHESGELISRVEALRGVSSYVKDNDLKVKDKKRLFKVDDKLKTIFSEFDEMQYTQIMGGLSRHFL